MCALQVPSLLPQRSELCWRRNGYYSIRLRHRRPSGLQRMSALWTKHKAKLNSCSSESSEPQDSLAAPRRKVTLKSLLLSGKGVLGIFRMVSCFSKFTRKLVTVRYQDSEQLGCVPKVSLGWGMKPRRGLQSLSPKNSCFVEGSRVSKLPLPPDVSHRTLREHCYFLWNRNLFLSVWKIKKSKNHEFWNNELSTQNTKSTARLLSSVRTSPCSGEISKKNV